MTRAAGKLSVVGLGPGDPGLLAPAARAALLGADLLVGYTTYLELLEPEVLQGREVLAAGMRQEMDRAAAAVRAAQGGRRVAVVCSGDAGIYGLAGLVLELAAEMGALQAPEPLDIEVLPGITALSAAAALLGAPLTHDFAVVSLSDLLTPWEVIERRVQAAAQADFVLGLYNPTSRRRTWQLPRVLELLAAHRAPQTPVGHVRAAFRPEQSVHVTALTDFDPASVDMLSLLVVGNASTRILDGRMVTPRGYLDKYGKTC